jgi:hypothetical protein
MESVPGQGLNFIAVSVVSDAAPINLNSSLVEENTVGLLGFNSCVSCTDGCGKVELFCVDIVLVLNSEE